MKRKRRTHSSEFKARVALEALKGITTVNRIAQQEGVLPVQVSNWKKELLGRLPGLFESGARRYDEETRLADAFLRRYPRVPILKRRSLDFETRDHRHVDYFGRLPAGLWWKGATL